MSFFDLSSDPPSVQQIKDHKSALLQRKRRQVKASLISDGLHGGIFLILYLTDQLSGAGFLLSAVPATFIAVVLAMSTRDALAVSDRFSVALLSLGTLLATYLILYHAMHESWLGATVAAAAAMTIVLAGFIIGRKLKQILAEIENLETIADNEYAQQDVQILCQAYPQLENYRQQARNILRPYLTYGELLAMHDWAKRKTGSAQHT